MSDEMKGPFDSQGRAPAPSTQKQKDFWDALGAVNTKQFVHSKIVGKRETENGPEYLREITIRAWL